VLLLRENVMRRGRRRLLADGVPPPELQPGGAFEGRPGEFALGKFNYYKCGRCKEPYFGGDRACGPAAGGGGHGDEGGGGGGGDDVGAIGGDRGERAADHELVCGACSVTDSGAGCGKHGLQELQYKCRYCCDVAVWFCFGTTHFCDRCHTTRPDSRPCAPLKRCNPRTCPLKVDHPAHGVEFCLGCSLCRSTGNTRS